MADYQFRKAKNWQELVDAHETWMTDYNAQSHWAHRDREDGRRTPQGVLGFQPGLLRHREDDLERAVLLDPPLPASSTRSAAPASGTGGCTRRRD